MNKGELKLCTEGQRLYDEYCNELAMATETKFLVHVFAKDELWKEFLKHRLECEECCYV